MSKQQIRLWTWKQWVLLTGTFVAWLCYRLYRDYKEKGGVETKDWVIYGIVFLFATSVAAIVARRANSPEKYGEPDELERS